MVCLESAAQIHLLGGFELICRDGRISLPLGAQRLLSFLALQDDGVHRAVAAERLWPDTLPRRAAANLRSALWRGRQVADLGIVDLIGPRLRLSRSTSVDVRRLRGEALQALNGPNGQHNGQHNGDLECLAHALRLELLPDWHDDWLVLERERWDQVRLHMLEALAQRLCGEQQFLPALQTALTAIGIEPVRETAHRIVIEVHLAEGNAASALRHYQRYRALLQRELGVAPSARMAKLAEHLLPS
jgi:DNA-binding SARP family transcriptional activator